MSSFEHIHDFKQAMSVHGITPPETIITDGKIHRFGHKKNSWYVFHQGDISGGAFGDWKLNVSETWFSKQPNQFDKAEREAWIKQQAEIQASVKAEKLAKQAEAAKKSIKLWADARPDVDLKHGYLLAKGSIYPHGIKQLGQALLIPVYGEDKQLTGCQFIYANGDKKFLTGTKKKGSFHFLKPQNFDPNNVQIVCIVEGWANGVTVLMAMNCLVFIAFDCGNLLAVAELARRKYPHALIVMCADVEDHRTGIKAASEAANAVNGVAAIPTGQTDENGKLDFNDVFKTHGIEAVKKMIDEAIETKKAVPPSDDGTAPLNDDLARESIDDVGNGGEDKIISHIDNSGHKKSQPTVLIEMADDCELFHTSDDEAYAVVKTPTSRQVFAVRSAGFRRYLSQRYFKLFGKGVGNQALQDALITIEAKANFNGTLRQVYKRVANLGDRIYLDLCDEKWRVIEVTAAGWQVLNCSPVMFTRTKDMLSIPEPKNDASDAILSVNDLVKNKEEKYKNIYLLKRFVNVRDEDYPLIYAFILACLRGIKPYPVLLLQGESGTGKTTTARNMRGLIDPSKADVLGKPKDENELKTCANNSYILAIDNLSGLSKDFSDVVCQIATGASSSKRKLYTDNDVETYEIARPIILNGIDDIASRGDLLNRSFQVNLPALNDDKKGDEQELATQYNQAKPVILAAFLDMLSVGLRDYDKIEKIKTSGRFVSLPRFVTAAERGLGLPELFAKTYDQNTKQGVELALETSPLAQALITFMSLKTIWTGTIGELFQQLNDRFKTDFLTLQSGSWPKTPRYLSGELTRLAPQLRQTHIDIKTKKESHGMTITLEKVRKIASLASLASLNNKNNELQDEPSVIVASGLHHSSVINDEVASFSIIEEPSYIKGCDANDANDARFSKDSNNSAMTWEVDL